VQWVGTDSASVEGGRAVAAALSASRHAGECSAGPRRSPECVRWWMPPTGWLRQPASPARFDASVRRDRLLTDVAAPCLGSRVPGSNKTGAMSPSCTGVSTRGRSSRSSRRGLRPTRSTGARMSDSSPSRWRAAALAQPPGAVPGVFSETNVRLYSVDDEDAAAFGSSPCTRHAWRRSPLRA